MASERLWLDAHRRIRSATFRFGECLLTLYAAIFEYTTYNNVSTNGEIEFYHIMKKMLPDNNGTPLPDLYGPNNPTFTMDLDYEFMGSYNIPADASTPIDHLLEHSVEDFQNLGVVVWIQDEDTKYIVQSATANMISSTNNLDTEVQILVFPNPSIDKLNVVLADLQESLSKQEELVALNREATAHIAELNDVMASGTNKIVEEIQSANTATVAASKAVVVDSNKDAASFRNVTLTGTLTAADLEPLGLHWMPTLAGDKQMVLADGKVLFQGQEVAFVVGDDRYAVADGVSLVEVEYEELPVVTDPFKAELKDAMDHLDENGDGTIGEDEFVKWFVHR